MKVHYDARWILLENRFDGVSRYTHELAWALSRQPDIELVWIIHDIRQLAKLPDRPHVLANEPANLMQELSLPSLLNREGAEIVYSPFFMMGTLGRRYKLVLTIHDTIYFRHRTPPQWLPWHVRTGWRLFHLSYTPMRLQLNGADAIATVSNTARQELLDVKATKRDITPVLNAVSDAFLDTTPRDHYDKNSVVYMGAFTPYKNVECLIDALEFLPEVTLHLCGKVPAARRPEIEKYIADRGVTDRVILYDGATDDQYKEALRNARCAVSASRMEGFGLPLIEAQQAGVPFAAADTEIFHEIGEDSVLYFDPDNPKECAERIAQFADLRTSNDYVERGYNNAARYTWQSSAENAVGICTQLKD